MWSVILALIPKKYLIGAVGAVLMAGTLVGFIAHHQHALKAAYFAKGYRVAADSAKEATIVREIALRDSATKVADSLRAHRDTLIVTRTVAQRPGISVDTVPLRVACDSIPPLVSVYVESERRSYPAHPALAKLLVWQDSVIYKALVPAIAQRDSLYAAEHNARLASDSALVLARQHTEPISPHRSTWKRDALLVLDGVLLAKYGPALLRGLAHLHPHL